MPFSQHKVQDLSGWTPAPRESAEVFARDGDGLSSEGENTWLEGENPWREAAILLFGKARRHLWLILAAALACAILAGLSKSVITTTYKASTQILIDPQETRSFEADAPASTLEASAAINYVESQMGVIGSERVLLRVIRDQGLAGSPPPASEDSQEAPQAPESDEARRARELAENKALIVLQKAVTIQRAERSFLINVTVADKSPERAALLANALVKAYGEVNSVDRNNAARRLAAELNARAEDTRRQIGETETRMLNFKVEHNLVGLNDKSILERRMSEATDALAASENREAQARARLKQLESAPKDLGGVASFGPDPESRQLQVLIEGRAAARSELEQLETTLGDRHPAVIAGRLRLREFDRRIAQNLDGLRRSTRAQLAEAQAQTAALTKRLSDFAAEITNSREADVALREMEDQIEAKRKAQTALEARQREANDRSRVETPSFRIVSPARVPNVQGKTVGVILWALCGGLIGAALALAGLALTTLFDDGEPDPVASRANNSGTTRDNPEPSPELDVIATLPALAPSGRRRLSAADAMNEVLQRPGSEYAKAVETLYDRLKPPAIGPIVVLVAATEPRAGASTLAANLARVAAARGKRALLIDAHLARPSLNLTIPEDAPKTLIELAGLRRPLYRLAPFSQSLSLIPAFAQEDKLCRAIAEDSGYRPIDRINGNFDFVVFDGPDAGDPEALRDLVPVVGQVFLVVPAEAEDDEDLSSLLPRLLRRLGAERQKFSGFVRASPRRAAAATAA